MMESKDNGNDLFGQRIGEMTESKNNNKSERCRRHVRPSKWGGMVQRRKLQLK
jgi:hypothetical protein